MCYLKHSPMAGGSVGTTSVGVVDGGRTMVGLIVAAEIGSIIPGIEKNTELLIYQNRYLIKCNGVNKLCRTKNGVSMNFLLLSLKSKWKCWEDSFCLFLGENGLKADLSKLSLLSYLLTKGNGTLLFNFLAAKSNNICASDQSQCSISLQCSTF